MSIKYDTEKKFKWLHFDKAPPFDEETDIKYKLAFKDRQTDFIIGFTLTRYNLGTCAGNVTMFTTVEYQPKKNIIIEPLFGIYKLKDLDPKKLDNLPNISESVKSYITTNIITSRVKSLNNDSALEQIKKKFRECANENLFVVGLTVRPIQNEGTSHSNILIIRKNKGDVLWIEPETTVNQQYETLMIKSIQNLVTEIGMPNPTVVNPIEVCPQAITKDRNCLTWSYMIFQLIMMNPDKEYNELIKNYTQKYPTKEELADQINGFKKDVYDNILFPTAGGKRRKTRRLKKNRRTKRRR